MSSIFRRGSSDVELHAHGRGRSTDPSDRLLVPLAASTLILVLGIIGLGTRSIWMDESITAGLARGSLDAMRRGIAEDGGTQSLYVIAARLTSFLGNDEWAFRVPSLIAAALVPFPLYRLAALSFGSRVAARTVAVLAVSYVFIANAQDARSYTMLAAIIVWSWLLLQRALEQPSQERWMLWGAVTALTPYAQPLGLPILVGQAIWMGLNRHRIRPGDAAVGFAVAAVLSLPFAYLTIFHAGDHTGWLGQFTVRGFSELVGAAFGAQRASDALLLTASGTAFALVFALLAIAPKQVLPALALRGSPDGADDGADPDQRLLFFLWVATPLVILVIVSASRAFFLARYAVPLIPATATLVAIGIERLGQRSMALANASFVVLVGLLFGRTLLGYGEETIPWDDLQAYVAEEATASDIVAFEPPHVQAPFEYYTWHRGNEATMARPMSPAEGWTAPRHPNLDLYPTSPLESPDGDLWIVLAPDEGRVPAIIGRFEIPMTEVERVIFGEATVLRFERQEP